MKRKQRRMTPGTVPLPSHRLARHGVALTSALCAAGSISAVRQAEAQQSAPVNPTNEVLPELILEGENIAPYKPETVVSPKFTQPLVNIPQTITVIPQSVIEEQGAFTLRDVLRNVPGISIQAGEGGVPAGDNLSIRGFNARTDLFIDGIRDFGGYSRDPFNLEQVEVSKGPASSNAGRGSTGGSINIVSKTPRLGSFYGGDFSLGTDDLYRSTLDLNHQLNDSTAFRMNVLYHESDTPGRDSVGDQRWGLAPSLAFGLGTDTRFKASYFHLEQNNQPDYGIPWVPPTITDPRLTPFIDQPSPVSFGNYYGLLTRDYELTTTDVGTLLFEHDFSDDFKFRNQFRYGQTVRDSVITAPRFTGVGSEVRRQIQSRDQTDTIVANQTDFTVFFDTGTIGHELVTGFEFIGEESENYLRAGADSFTDLFSPNPGDPYAGTVSRTGAVNSASSTSAAIYAFDTVHLTNFLDVTGGLRWESFDVDYRSRAADGTTTNLSRLDEMLSWRSAIVVKPADNGSVYFGYGTSFNPSAEGLTLGNTATAANGINLDPEQSNTMELGTKWELFGKRLLVSGAVFQTDKTNARTSDPADPDTITVLDGEQRVQGFELGLGGNITDQWQVFGGYTLLSSEVLSSLNPLEVGNELSNTPEHSFSLWTTYDLPLGFQVGVGAQFVDSRYNSNLNVRQADAYWIYDAMIGYKVNDNFSLRLNGYNLLNEDYIDRVGGGHFVPGVDRSVMLTGSIQF